MHGVEECAGNIQELCAIHLSQDQQQWWTFVQCLNFEGRSSIGDAGLAQKCASVAKIRWDDEDEEVGMQTCINGDIGKEFLVDSLTHSQKLGITYVYTFCKGPTNFLTRSQHKLFNYDNWKGQVYPWWRLEIMRSTYPPIFHTPVCWRLARPVIPLKNSRNSFDKNITDLTPKRALCFTHSWYFARIVFSYFANVYIVTSPASPLKIYFWVHY